MKKDKLTTTLQTTTTSTGLPASAITRNRCNILDTSNLHTVPSKGPQSTLCTRSRASTLIPSSSSNLNMKRGDTKLLAPSSDILGGKHSGIRWWLISVSFDLHSPSDTDKCLTARKIGYVNKCIIKWGEKVRYGKDLLIGNFVATNPWWVCTIFNSDTVNDDLCICVGQKRRNK